MSEVEEEEVPRAAAPRPVRSLTVFSGEPFEPDYEYPVGSLLIPPVVVGEEEISSVGRGAEGEEESKLSIADRLRQSGCSELFSEGLCSFLCFECAGLCRQTVLR